MLSRRIMLGSGVRRCSFLTWESLKYQEDPSPRHQGIPPPRVTMSSSGSWQMLISGGGLIASC